MKHVAFCTAILFLFFLGIVPGSVFASVGINKQINYQGVLKNDSGVKVSDGDYDIVFKIYDAATDGNLLWTGTHTSGNGNAVTVTDGVFSVLLGSGSGNTLNLDFNSDTYYLGVKIGSDPEMTPRKRLGASGYAFNTDKFGGFATTTFLRIDNASASYFAATSTTQASTFPYASTTALTVLSHAFFNSSTTFNGVEYLFPFSDGSNGQVLSTNAAGGLSWVDAGGGGTFISLSDTPSSLSLGDVLYADGANSLAKLTPGANGQVLKLSGGVPVWSADLQGGGGGSGLFATTTDDLVIYPVDTADVLVIGNNATTSTGNIFEVVGNSLFDDVVFVNSTSTSFYSTTLGTNSEYFTDLTGVGLTNTSGVLTLDATGDWTGTFDGQEGSYYLDAPNLTNFGTPFYTYFNATNTTALSEGSNLYWTDTRFDERLSATTTLPNLTTLLGLTNATSTSLTITGNSWFTDTVTARHIVPEAHTTYDLGESGNKWDTAYIKKIRLGASSVDLEELGGALVLSGALSVNSVRVGASAGEVDTSSGNLTLDSVGGTVLIDDELSVISTTTLSAILDLAGNRIIGVATPVNTTDGANKGYVDNYLNGLVWQEPVTTAGSTTPPGAPSTGERHVVGESATGDWSGYDNYVAEYNGASWDFASSTVGWTSFVNNVSKQYSYNGTTWVEIGSDTNHNILTGLQGGQTAEYFHLKEVDYNALTHVNSQLANLQTTGDPTFNSLQINSESFSDLTGTGLVNYANVLNVSTTTFYTLADWFATTTHANITSLPSLVIDEAQLSDLDHFDGADFYTYFSATTTDALSEGSSNLYSQWSTSGSNINYTGGNIGIGETSPASKLDIGGVSASADGDALRIGVDGEYDASIKFYDDDAESTQHFKMTFGAGNQDLKFHSDQEDDILYLSQDGFVGVGNSSPSLLLSVGDDLTGSYAGNRMSVGNSSGDSAVMVGESIDDRGYMYWSSSNDHMSFGTVVGGTSYTGTIMLKSGNVGMGDSTPDGLLEISASGGVDDLLLLSSADANDGDLFIVKNSGNIGIGTSTPQGLFAVATSTDSSFLMVDSDNGFVGVGTDDPIKGLVVSGSSEDSATIQLRRFGNAPRFEIVTAGGTEASPTAVTSGQAISFINYKGYDGSAYGKGAQQKITATENWSGTAHGAKMEFKTVDNGTIALDIRMVIDQSGYVGIGTTTPAYPLDVDGNFRVGEAGNSDVLFVDATSGRIRVGETADTSDATLTVAGADVPLKLYRSSDSTSAPSFIQYKSRGTISSPTTVQAGDVVGAWLTNGYDGNSYESGGRIRMYVDSVSDENLATDMRFDVTDSSGTLTEVLRLDSSGNVGIGETSPDDLLDVDGDIRVGSNNDGCVKDGNGTVIAGTCSSDINLKKDIEPVVGVLDKLVQIEPVTYNWRVDEFPEYAFGASTSIGYIAQNVEEYFPEYVGVNQHGHRTVNFTAFQVLAVQAIRELNLKIEELESDTGTKNKELGIGNDDSPSSSNLALSSFLDWLKDKIVYAKQFVADHVKATILDTDVANVASKIKSPKIITERFEMKDGLTGDTWCVRLWNGEWDKFKGTCGDVVEVGVHTPQDVESLPDGKAGPTSLIENEIEEIATTTSMNEVAPPSGGTTSTTTSATTTIQEVATELIQELIQGQENQEEITISATSTSEVRPHYIEQATSTPVLETEKEELVSTSTPEILVDLPRDEVFRGDLEEFNN